MKYLNLAILFFQLLYQAVTAPSLHTGFNFLVLGLDPRDDSLEKTEVTDTIILARLNSNWQVNLISLPRDLWSYPLSAKINQIYPLSLTQPNSLNYVQQSFQEITGQKYTKTIVVTTQNLQEIIGLVGGVDVYLEQGFTDKLYPNPDYIKNPHPPTPVYITVNYPSGWNHLDSSNITPFVRSRHSTETAQTGGTDIGRTIRQQLLIEALVSKIKSDTFLKDPQNLLKLYEYWHQHINTNFTDLDFMSLAIEGRKNITNLKIKKTEIPTGENPKTDLIYHPQKFVNPQWVFIPQTTDYQSLKNFINQNLLY